MDIIGTVASAIDLITTVVSYVQAIKDAKDDRQKLLSEVSALGIILRSLHSRVENTKTTGSDDGVTRLQEAGIEAPLHQYCDILRSTAEKLKHIASQSNIGKSISIREKMKDVTWPFRQKEIGTMLDDMERLKASILLALQLSSMISAEETRTMLEGVGGHVDRIMATVSAIETAQRAHMNETKMLRFDLNAKFGDMTDIMSKNQQDQMILGDQAQADLRIIKRSVYDQEVRDILKWLSPLDFSEKQNAAFEKRAPNTGTWFLEHPKFLAWRSGESKMLWCPGGPAVGKSVMASLVIHELGKAIHENTALVFIFFEYKTRYTVHQLAEVILKQLMQRHMTRSGLESLRKHKAGIRPTSEELFDMLKVEMGTYDRVFVVIDALDEIDVGVWTPLLQNLQALGEVSLVATSRDTGEIESGLWPYGYQRLNIMADEGDMRRYIQGQFESSPKFKRLVAGRKDVQEEITAKIMEKADGMFLLAHLHMNSLETKHNINTLRRALEVLPRTLDATYDEAMSRISSDDKALAHRIISWLIHAVRPMSISDLQYALAVEDGSNGMMAVDIDDLCNETDLTSICVGLVVLREDTGSNPHASSNVIGLVHYTAQEYFLHNPNVSAQFADSAHFAITCLQYLACDTFKTDISPGGDRVQKQLRKVPFAEYAMLSWGVHARMHWDNRVVQDLATKLLYDDRRVVTVGSIPCRAKDLSAIHLCAHFGLEGHLESLLNNGCDINSKDSDGDTAVSYAAIDNQEDIMQLLLARDGVNVNPKGWKGTTPLDRAIRGGHEGIVQLLLARRDVNVNPRSDVGDTPIIEVAVRGDSSIMTLLLARDDVNINSRGQDGRTPLSAAALHGNEAIVRLLLMRDDLDVNSRNKFGDTPIILSAWKGHGGIVELLLGREGVDVNSHNENGSTPLSLAICGGHEAVAWLLLARDDLDVNSHNKSGDTPIILATWKGHGGIVELLLGREGVDVNSRNKNGLTPLSLAICGGHEAVVRLLLARDDLDVNSRNNSGDTPIILAAWKGDSSIVELLLARGDMDVNSQNLNGYIPLSAAIGHGHEVVVQLLLARDDLDVNLRNKFGDTPIILAARKGHGGIVELLLGRDGVDINSHNENGSTSLSSAIRGGHKTVIQLLLERVDLDTSWRNGNGNTYLAIAAQYNDEEITKWLLTKGNIDINSKNPRGRGPLTIAALMGNSAVVGLLLDQDGIDVNLVDSNGRTPLDHAIRKHHEGTIELLQAAGGRTGAPELRAEFEDEEDNEDGEESEDGEENEDDSEDEEDGKVDDERKYTGEDRKVE